MPCFLFEFVLFYTQGEKMRRFGRRFEVKNEIIDGGKIRPDSTNSRKKEDKEFQEELERVGFEDSFESEKTEVFSIKDEAHAIQEVDENIHNKFYHLNREAELELEEFYDDSISNDSLQRYLEEKISAIYGRELGKYQLASAKEIVETFLENNYFEGVRSYQQLTEAIEDTLKIMHDNEKKALKRIEETLGEDGIKRLVSGYQNTMSSSELLANAYVATEAKKLFVDKGLLKFFLREQQKKKILFPEKVLHYHRTSLENAEKILEMGALLNRANLKQAGVDISKFAGSSSAHVQFSVDRYSENGELVNEGFNLKDNVGASSDDVVFVMGTELMHEETYDNFAIYPTVEKADVKSCCIGLLAKNLEVQEKLQALLQERGMQIPVMLQKDFDREILIQNWEESGENEAE